MIPPRNLLLIGAGFAAGIATGMFLLPQNSPFSANKAAAESAAATAPWTQSTDATTAKSNGKKTRTHTGATAFGSRDVTAAVKALLGEQRGRKRFRLIRDFADSLDAAQLKTALTALQREPFGENSYWLISELSGRWAELDPRGALNFAGGVTNRQTRNIALGSIISTWAEADSGAAAQWVAALPAGNEKRDLESALIHQLTRINPDQAIEQMKEKSRGGDRYGMAWSVFDTWAMRDAPGASQRVLSLPPGIMRRNAISVIARRWATQDTQAALAWCNSLTSPQERSQALQQIISQKCQEAPSAAVEIYDSLPSSQNKAQAASELAGSWAQTDPAAALKWAESLSGNARNFALENILSNWAEQDAKGALDYAMSQPAGGRRINNISDVVSNWLRNDPDAAIDWIEKLPDDSLRSRIIERSSFCVIDGDYSRAIDLIALMPPGQNQDSLLQNALSNWASNDPQGALAWAAQQTDEHVLKTAWPGIASAIARNDPDSSIAILDKMPAASRNDAMQQIAGNWAQEDPKAAAGWAMKITDENMRGNAVGNILNNWLHNDPDSARAWAQTMPPGKARDQAISNSVWQLFHNDPESAASWISMIGDEKMRNSQLNDLASHWLSNDENAARAWIPTSPLPDDVKNRLLSE